jgi:hypothetical protein
MELRMQTRELGRSELFVSALMPMQPSPSADTNNPDLPSSRVSIVSSTIEIDKRSR